MSAHFDAARISWQRHIPHCMHCTKYYRLFQQPVIFPFESHSSCTRKSFYSLFHTPHRHAKCVSCGRWPPPPASPSMQLVRLVMAKHTPSGTHSWPVLQPFPASGLPVQVLLFPHPFFPLAHAWRICSVTGAARVVPHGIMKRGTLQVAEGDMYLHERGWGRGWGVHLQVKLCAGCAGMVAKRRLRECICSRKVCKRSRCRRDLQHLLHAGQLVAGLAQRRAALHLFCIHRLPALEVNHLPAWVMGKSSMLKVARESLSGAGCSNKLQVLLCSQAPAGHVRARSAAQPAASVLPQTIKPLTASPCHHSAHLVARQLA